MDWTNYISVNPKIMFGKPVITGTRIPVDLITEKLSMGESFEYLLSAYPHLKAEQLYACLAYATSVIRNEEAFISSSAA